jgi:hypothetical protein
MIACSSVVTDNMMKISSPIVCAQEVKHIFSIDNESPETKIQQRT